MLTEFDMAETTRKLVYGEDDRVGGWIFGRLDGKWYSGRAVTIGWERPGELIAGAAFENYNGVSVFASLAVDGMASKEFLVAAFAFPFVQLGVKKIIGLVDESNKRAVDLDEHLGFVLEHRIENAHPDGALLVYSMTREQCRFLGRSTYG